jgi:hypothetical protein
MKPFILWNRQFRGEVGNCPACMDIGYLGQKCLSCAAGENYEAHIIINQPEDNLDARDPIPYYINPEFLHRYMLQKPGREPVLPEHERRSNLADYPNSVIVEFDHQADSIDYVLHFPSDTAQRNVHRPFWIRCYTANFISSNALMPFYYGKWSLQWTWNECIIDHPWIQQNTNVLFK